MVFKEATASDEIVQLHRLNYQTFVEELKQYEPNEAGALIDRFHEGTAILLPWMGNMFAE